MSYLKYLNCREFLTPEHKDICEKEVFFEKGDLSEELVLKSIFDFLQLYIQNEYVEPSLNDKQKRRSRYEQIYLNRKKYWINLMSNERERLIYMLWGELYKSGTVDLKGNHLRTL